MRLICLIFAAAACLAVPTLADEQCPPLMRMAGVDLVATKNGRVLVPVTVNGEQYYFTLGTATPMTTISAALAEKLKLTRIHSAVKFVDLAGDVADRLAVVPQFGIGTLRAGPVNFVVAGRDTAAPSPGVQVPSGTLGADFLRAYDVDLDFGAGKLNLISREHCEGAVLYWKPEHVAKVPMLVTDENKIFFSMTLDGHDLQTVLNTGVPTSSVRMSTAATVYDVDNNTPGNQPAGRLNKDTQLFSHVFKEMSINGLVINNPRLVLLPSLAEQTIRHMQAPYSARMLADVKKQPELVLGMAELRQLHVYIDYHNQTLYLSPANDHGGAP
jgi:hypothetical protein